MSSENIAPDTADLDLIGEEPAVEQQHEAPAEKQVETKVEAKPAEEKKITQREALAKVFEEKAEEKPGDKAKKALFGEDGKPAIDPEKPRTSVVKPPANLPADIRESFADLPANTQHYLAKREADIQKALSETAVERKLASSHKEAWAPYEQILKNDGVSSDAMTKELAQMYGLFKTGTSAQKAQVIANLVGAFRPSIQDLQAALSKIPVNGQAPVQQVNVQAEVERTLAQRQEQELHSRARQEADNFFANDKYEFRHDVRTTMGALLSAGEAQTLDEAYKMAVKANPKVQAILKDRAAKRQNASTAAQTGIRGSNTRPAPAAAPKPKTQRDALSAAFDRFTSKE